MKWFNYFKRRIKVSFSQHTCPHSNIKEMPFDDPDNGRVIYKDHCRDCGKLFDEERYEPAEFVDIWLDNAKVRSGVTRETALALIHAHAFETGADLNWYQLKPYRS